MRALLLLALCLWPWSAFADDLVVCDPTHPQVPNAVTRFDQSLDATPFLGRSGFLVWTAPHNDMTLTEQTKMILLRGQLDALAGIPTKYWKCVDLSVPANGTLDGVVEMSAVEKTAIDAPAVAERNRVQALRAEQTQLKADLDQALAGWGGLTAAQRTEALRKSMRLLRVQDQLQSD